MKKIALYIVITLFATNFFAQTKMNGNTIEVFNFDCYSAYPLCFNVEGYFRLDSKDNPGKCDLKPISFSFKTNESAVNGLKIRIYEIGVTLYGPFQCESIFNCEAIASNLAQKTERSSSDAVGGYVYFDVEPGFYILELNPIDCSSEFKIELVNGASFNCKQDTDCQNCITSFSPEPGKYVVSGWVKELGVSPTVLTYSNSKIVVSYEGNSSFRELTPTGKIIDGWQRIEGIVDVPADATDIHLTLQAANNNAVFDDIRFYPNDGSMMSYVYDPITLKLVAELDERNYATYYEYDEEGKLIRIKKETEKGIMTIQENRDNIVKKP